MPRYISKPVNAYVLLVDDYHYGLADPVRVIKSERPSGMLHRRPRSDGSRLIDHRQMISAEHGLDSSGKYVVLDSVTAAVD